MQVEWATHCVQSLIKNLKFGKSHNVNEVKTIGSVCNIILMKSYHERIEVICDVWSPKWVLCCCIHMIVCNGVLYAVEIGES